MYYKKPARKYDKADREQIAEFIKLLANKMRN